VPVEQAETPIPLLQKPLTETAQVKNVECRY